jgi:hypothetical protein
MAAGHLVADGATPHRTVRRWPPVDAIDLRLNAPSTIAKVAERLQALGSEQDPAIVPQHAARWMIELLTPLVAAIPSLGAMAVKGPSLTGATARVRASLFSDIEARCRDYGARTHSPISLGAIEEWRLWAQLHDRADQLLALQPDVRASLSHLMVALVNNFAVYQQSKWQRGALAYSMYDWLARNAETTQGVRATLSNNARGVRP